MLSVEQNLLRDDPFLATCIGGGDFLSALGEAWPPFGWRNIAVIRLVLYKYRFVIWFRISCSHTYLSYKQYYVLYHYSHILKLQTCAQNMLSKTVQKLLEKYVYIFKTLVKYSKRLLGRSFRAENVNNSFLQ
jgi:hypothetical protein